MFLKTIVDGINLIITWLSKLLFREKNVTEAVAVVTGGAQGIGLGIAKQLLRRGCQVVILDLNKQHLDKTVSELKSANESKQVHGYLCDVSKVEEVKRIVGSIAREVGDIDILVNNAGIIFAKRMEELEPSEVQKIIGVNLLAHFWLIQSILPGMKKREKGMVINISSMAGVVGTPLLSSYAATKFGVVGHSESLRNELLIEKSPVTVHVAMPFIVRTAMNDIWYPPAIKSDEVVSGIMDSNYCADQIVSQALQGRFKIYIPPSGALYDVMRGTLPQWIMDRILPLTGTVTLSPQ